jgi:uncharacterized repeat protein (TIGR03803 family)
MNPVKGLLPMALTVAGIVFGWTDLSAQPVSLIHTFSATTGITNWDGVGPQSDLALSGETLYGTAPTGGTNGFGTLFAVNADGTGFTVLHSFGYPYGAIPGKDLLLTNGMLFGTVGQSTNLDDYGAIFCVATNGSNFSLVYPFPTTALGSYPKGLLALGGDTLYGMASTGGISNSGSIFSVNTNGNDFNVLHYFNRAADGFFPLGGLLLAGGTLYGTARDGGSNSFGTVFSIDTNGGNFTVLHTFSGNTNSDGELPDGGLILAGDTLYGTTSAGSSAGSVFSIETNGDAYSVIHSFNNALGDGRTIESSLVLSGNTLYGTTVFGGTNSNSGTVFSVNTDGGSFTVLHTFSAVNSSYRDTNSDGAESFGGLALSGDVLYGTTSLGGTNGTGTVFSLTIQPRITDVVLSGADLLLGGINGMAGHTYRVLSSTDFAAPLDQWRPVATNVLGSGGNFTLTATNAVNPGFEQQFYTLSTP